MLDVSPVSPSSVRVPAKYAMLSTRSSSKPRLPIQNDLACGQGIIVETGSDLVYVFS